MYVGLVIQRRGDKNDEFSGTNYADLGVMVGEGG